MKEDLIEYHPNGKIKHEISFWGNGQKYHEQFYDKRGNFHRKQGLPACQLWYSNERKSYASYGINGRYHNICNPARIWYFEFSKIWEKHYYINDNQFNNKLNWQNMIKNI